MITCKSRKSISKTAANTTGWKVEIVSGTASARAPNARNGHCDSALLYTASRRAVTAASVSSASINIFSASA